MNTRDVQVIGAREVEAALRGLPQKVQRRAMRRALNMAGTPIVRRARSLAPVDDGDLRRSLGKKVTVDRNPAAHSVLKIGPRTKYPGKTPGKSPANYAHLVEFGTAAHKIPARPILKIGPLVVRGVVSHPGSAAQPFLRPAFESTKAEALARFRTKLVESIERLASRGGR